MLKQPASCFGLSGKVLDVSELRALRDRKAELWSVQCAVDEHPQLNGLAWVNPVRV